MRYINKVFNIISPPLRIAIFYVCIVVSIFAPVYSSLPLLLFSIFILSLEFKWLDKIKNKKIHDKVVLLEENLSLAVKNKTKDTSQLVADFIIISQHLHTIDDSIEDLKKNICYNLNRILGYQDNVIYFNDLFQYKKIHFTHLLESKKYAKFLKDYFRDKNVDFFFTEYENLLDLKYPDKKLNFYASINTFLLKCYLEHNTVDTGTILKFLDRMKKHYSGAQVEMLLSCLLKTDIDTYPLVQWAQKSSSISAQFFEENFPNTNATTREPEIEEIEGIVQLTHEHLDSPDPQIKKEAQEVLQLVNKIKSHIRLEEKQFENDNIHKELRIHKNFLMKKINEHERQ